MRGRKPTPTVLKLARGNPGHRPLNANEPMPDVKAPPCPRELDAVARKEWNRMAKVLLNLGLLTELDRAALAGYCVSWSQWVQALEKVQQIGPIIKAPSGFPVQNPYLAVANRAGKEMRSFLIEFGMTPGSRSRVQAVKPTSSAADTKRARFFGAERKA